MNFSFKQRLWRYLMLVFGFRIARVCYTNLYTSRQSVVFKEAEIRSSFGFTA